MIFSVQIGIDIVYHSEFDVKSIMKKQSRNQTVCEFSGSQLSRVKHILRPPPKCLRWSQSIELQATNRTIFLLMSLKIGKRLWKRSLKMEYWGFRKRTFSKTYSVSLCKQCNKFSGQVMLSKLDWTVEPNRCPSSSHIMWKEAKLVDI